MEEKYIDLESEKIKIIVIRKRIRNMYMRMDDEGNLNISAPYKMSYSKIKEFIIQKSDWILKQKKKVNFQYHDRETYDFNEGDFIYFLGEKYFLKIIDGKENKIEIGNSESHEKLILMTIKAKYVGNKDYIRRFYEKWLTEQCYTYCKKYVDYYIYQMKNFNIEMPSIVIKKFKAKWGCCVPKQKKVEFSMNLIKVPKECLEYVVVHELSHLKYMHHDQKFYSFVELFIPDWKKRRTILNKTYGGIIK